MKPMMNKRCWLKAACAAIAATLLVALTSPVLALENGAERLVAATRDAQSVASCQAACCDSNPLSAGSRCAECKCAECKCAECKCAECKCAECKCAECGTLGCKCGDCQCADCKCPKTGDKTLAKPCCK